MTDTNTTTEYDPYLRRTSVSATDDHLGCKRRRWLKKRCKLPTPQKTASIFGDVAHAVAERYFGADDRGMNSKGKPVDLYPAGWMTMKSRYAKPGDPTYTISTEEAVLIKALATKAISEGYWVREPGRLVEYEFDWNVYKRGLKKINFIGFIDLYNPNEVIDHKFVKNMNYALSVKRGAKRDIRTNTQMMSYAMIKYLDGHKGDLHLTMLYYVKDFEFPQVNRRSVTVTELEVRQFWNNHTLPAMIEMMEIDFKYPQHRMNEFLKVAGADDCNECNFHYGESCPFIRICTDYTTIKKYLLVHDINMEKLIEKSKQKDNINQEGNNKMSGLMDDIKKQQAEHAAGNVAGVGAIPAEIPAAPAPQPAAPVAPVAPAAEIPPAAPAANSLEDILGVVPAAPVPTAPVPAAGIPVPVAEVPVPAPVAPRVQPAVVAALEPAAVVPAAEQAAVPPVIQTTAPWYNDDNGTGCKVCGNNQVRGYNADMTVCVVCDAKNGMEGKLTSASFQAAANPDGTLTFTQIGEAVPVATVQAVAEPAVKTTVDTSTPAPVAPAAPAEAAQVPMIVTCKLAYTPGDEATEVPASTKTLTLMVGCAFIKNIEDQNVVMADEIMQSIYRDIEKTEGKEISMVDHFKVLTYVEAQVLKHYGPHLKDMGSTVVAFAASKSSPPDKMIECFRTIADIVIAPMAL